MRVSRDRRHPPPRSQTETATERLFDRLAEMTAAERIRAARDGELSHAERAIWAVHYPDEVPLVNGEFEWIALTLADLD